MLTILNFPMDSFSVWNMSSSKLKGYFVCRGGGGGGLCGGLLIGFCAFWFSCTMSCDCRLEMKCPGFGPPGGRRLGCFCDLSVLGAGTGLYPSLNCGGDGNMRSSYSLTICLTLLLGLGTGFLIVSLALGAGIGL